MIVDSSVVLALLFGEARATEAAEWLAQHSDSLFVSSVNTLEMLMRLHGLADESRRLKALTAFTSMPLQSVSVDRQHAETAARARIAYPKLNFGDCFAYAAAKLLSMPLLTFDSDFRGVDVEVLGLER